MKFREIFRFEFVYQARRVRTWLYFAVLFVVAYLLIEDSSTTRDGGVLSIRHMSSHCVTETLLTCLLWILMAPAVAGSAAARDVQTRMHPLIYTTPISKADYLGGRFLAAFVLNALILLAVPLGILPALFLPGVEPEIVGPFPSGRIPQRLRCSCVADRLHVHGGPVLAGSAETPSRRQLPRQRAVLRHCWRRGWRGDQRSSNADPRHSCWIPHAASLLVIISETLTPLEMNTALIGLESSMLANRLLWIGIALAMLAFTHRPLSPRSPCSVMRRISDSPGPADVRLRHPRAADVRHCRDCRSGRSRRVRPVSLLWRVAMLVVLLMPALMDLRGVPLLPRTAQVLDRSDRPGCRQSTASLGADPAAHRVLRRRAGLAGTGRRAERDRRRDAGAGMGLSSWASSWDSVSRSSRGWPS